MIKITCLGHTGYDMNQKKGLGFLVEINNFKILLDCGIYTIQALYEYGLKASDIDLIFISHEHVDHILGLPWFFNSLSFDEYYKVANENKNKKYFLMPSKESHFKKYIDENFSWMFNNNETQFIYHNEEKVYKLNNIKFEIFEINHGITNYGISMVYDNKKIIYVPDFDILKTKHINKIIENADISIFSIFGSSKYREEAIQYGFSTTKEVSTLCKKLEIKHLWFYHNFYDSDVIDMKKEIKECYGNSFNLIKPNEEFLV